jgi:probable F420-dependent oxidoreductase
MISVKIGLSGPSTAARQGRAAFFAYLDRVEALEWDSVWFSDRIVGPGWRMDPLAGMAMVAAHSERLKFGTSVLLMSMRNPVAMAKELATIDALSGGRRLILAVGVGQESPVEYQAMGVEKRERGRRLDEAMALMRRLWTEDHVTHASEFVKLNDATIGVHPTSPNIPVWVGGRSEPSFRRTGALGDGWLPSQVTPEEVAAGIERIRHHAAEAGRVVPDDHYGLQVSCYLVERGPVPASAMERLLARRTDVAPEAINLVGTPDAVMARLREYVDAGATKFVFNPACGPEELDAQLRLQAEAIVQPIHRKQVTFG